MASFRELKVWQRSIDLSVAIYRLTRDFLFGRTLWADLAASSCGCIHCQQHRRRIRTVLTAGDTVHFVGMARGSTLELQTQLVIVGEAGLGKQELMREVEGLSHEVGKMLWSLGKKL